MYLFDTCVINVLTNNIAMKLKFNFAIEIIHTYRIEIIKYIEIN